MHTEIENNQSFLIMHVCISTDMMVISCGDGIHCLMAACMVLYLAVMGF